MNNVYRENHILRREKIWKTDFPTSGKIFGISRDLEHVEQIANAHRFILKQSSMDPRMSILGTVFFGTGGFLFFKSKYEWENKN